MSLNPGSRLGPYEIVGAIGAGGMGEVYRARDTKLNRDVAIKVLPEAFAADAERLERFTREAQTLAALNHPCIATIFGLEEAGPQRALVMELVEGDDLSTRIARGPVPVADAIEIARQIADALEAAHEQGIVHRDLKPANVKVRADGTAKVLDFGLAKGMSRSAASGAADPANSPTLTARATQLGLIIGTAAYMAPEQAKGRSVDRRADIWAFGVVLFEMLTGRRAFQGDDISDVLASVLKSDVPWDALPAETPASIRRLLRRCLEKDPRRRLSAIGDARLELDEPEPVAPAGALHDAPTSRSIVSRWWPALAGVIVTAAAAAIVWPSGEATGRTPIRTSILAPAGTDLYPDSTSVVISPDGTQVALMTVNRTKSDSELWVRSLDTLEARRLDDGQGGLLPFWSPDGRRIGYFAQLGKLKTIAASGGRSEVVCDAPNGRGAVWTDSNEILFAPDAGGPLFKVPAAGGTPVPITTLDEAAGEVAHRFPTLLPDGDHFLYAVLPGKNGKFNIFAGSLADGSRTLVGQMEAAPVYAKPGWLLYARQGVLAAQAFDPITRKISGSPIALGDEPTVILDSVLAFTAGPSVSSSRTGSLAYYSAFSVDTTAVWIDEAGRSVGTLALPPAHYENVRISPDGTHAVLVRSVSPSEATLWLADLVRGGAGPLSTGPGRNDSPVWSPDSSRVAFASDRDGPQNIFIKSIVDATPETLLHRSSVMFTAPFGWSADGLSILISQLDPETAQNIWILPVGGGGPIPYVRGPYRDFGGLTTADSRWLVYLGEDTGRLELYAQAFPKPGGRVQLSRQGASMFWWGARGTKLFFLGADARTLWRVDVETSTTAFTASPPHPIATLPQQVLWMDGMPDGRRFLALVPERSGGSATIVQNWQALLAANR